MVVTNLKNWLHNKVADTGGKIAGKISDLSVLSKNELMAIQSKRDDYFSQLEEKSDTSELTESLLAANSVEIFNAYLPQISQLYTPVAKDTEYERPFDSNHNIRYFNITKWVIDKEENSLEKLINVYAVLSDADCNIALIFHRSCKEVQVYLAVTNNRNDDNNVLANEYRDRLADAIKGNFPGSMWKKEDGIGIPPCLNERRKYSVASASNIPTEKSEKFISQTIEKLLDGIIPENIDQEYTLILLATPIQDIETRKLRLAELYSGLAPYASWQTNFTYTESESYGSSANLGLNIGVSAGIQNGINQSNTNSHGITDSYSTGKTDTEGQSSSYSSGDSYSQSSGNSYTDSYTQGRNSSVSNTESDSFSNAFGKSGSHTDTTGSSNTVGGSVSSSVNTSVNASVTNTTSISGGIGVPGAANVSAGHSTGVTVGGSVGTSVGSSADYHHGWNQSASDTSGYSATRTHTSGTSQSMTQGTNSSVGRAAARNISSTVGRNIVNAAARSTSHALMQTVGKAVTDTAATTFGAFRSVNFGGNFGTNFARSSNITAAIGKNESITQNFTNYTIRHALELLEEQMKRYEHSTALGMWDFAAYVLSEEPNIASNVAHSYLALTQGENSYMSNTAVNLWRGNTEKNNTAAKEICNYLRELRHPVFALNPQIIKESEYSDFLVYPSMVTPTISLSGKELAYSLNFPKKSVSGFPVFTCAEFGRNIVTYEETEMKQKMFRLGNIFHMYHEDKHTAVALNGDSLCSHVFVSGSTGAGKSNTIYQILEQAEEHCIPFLVIEPAKGEYKNIFGSEPDVSVYGTNASVTPVLRMNPFSFPHHIHVLEHLDRLVEIFNVCWPMYAAMPAVLKQAVEKSYQDCGWNLTESVNPFGEELYPNFADVARNIRQIIDNSEYDNDNRGAYKGSLLTRLQSLTTGIHSLIFKADEIPDSDLFDKNVIIDLSRVGSLETKSLIMGILVIKLQEYRMGQKNINMPLKHLTVLEEAHHLLKQTSHKQTSESADLLGKSVEMLANAIAEMRTYGEGFIISDQAPGLMDMSVIRNTNTKIIMRLPDRADCELVGLSANLNQNQIEELAKLPCGVAAVYQNEWIQPVLCKVRKIQPPAKQYQYRRKFIQNTPNKHTFSVCIGIAECLSNGIKMDKEVVLKKICPFLKSMKLEASVQVRIMKMLLHPAKEPDMLALAPIMKSLFPEVYSAVQEIYPESSNPREWTEQAEQALSMLSQNTTLKAQVRRDIIQAIVTEYLLNEVRNLSDLEEWSRNGGLQ